MEEETVDLQACGEGSIETNRTIGHEGVPSRNDELIQRHRRGQDKQHSRLRIWVVVLGAFHGGGFASYSAHAIFTQGLEKPKWR